MSHENSPAPPSAKPRKFTLRRPDVTHLEKVGMVDAPKASALTGKSAQTLARMGLRAVKLGRTRLYHLSDIDALLRGEPLPARIKARTLR